ncbi:MAG: hypothetical protein ABJN84_08920 [Flavobacteriaceae bacterium]
MKTIYRTICITFLVLTASCSGSMESDAKKMADLMCESMQKAMGGALDAFDGNTNMKDLEAHGKNLRAFQQKMMDKYDDLEERHAFDSKVRKLMLENCI